MDFGVADPALSSISLMTCCAVTTDERKLLCSKPKDRDYLPNPSRTRQNALCGLARRFKVKLPSVRERFSVSLLEASTGDHCG